MLLALQVIMLHKYVHIDSGDKFSWYAEAGCAMQILKIAKRTESVFNIVDAASLLYRLSLEGWWLLE